MFGSSHSLSYFSRLFKPFVSIFISSKSRTINLIFGCYAPVSKYSIVQNNRQYDTWCDYHELSVYFIGALCLIRSYCDYTVWTRSTSKMQLSRCAWLLAGRTIVFLGSHFERVIYLLARRFLNFSLLQQNVFPIPSVVSAGVEKYTLIFTPRFCQWPRHTSTSLRTGMAWVVWSSPSLTPSLAY